jgi:hypothetical protein
MSESGNSTALSEEYLNEYSGNILVARSVSIIVLTTLFLALRFYAKRFSAAKLGLDDGLLVAAYVVDLGMCALGIGECLPGGGGLSRMGSN